jgi:hypothetical protein
MPEDDYSLVKILFLLDLPHFTDASNRTTNVMGAAGIHN